MRPLLNSFVLLCVSAGAAYASTPAVGLSPEDMRRHEIEAALEAFQTDSASFMEQRIPKWNERGELVSAPETRFTPKEIDSGEYVAAKDSLRSRMCMELKGKKRCLGEKGPGTLSGIWGEDQAENLVDVSITERRLEELEARGLMSAELAVKPWTDDYWPFYEGVLGKRYGDPNSPKRTRDWLERRNYSLNRPVSSIVRGRNQAEIDQLSPSEKYDLLIGDAYGTLTQGMWQKGAGYYYSAGYVAKWMGICEGWAGASIMLPRPEGVVTALAADGHTRLNFYPSDIKGLASLLWAYGRNTLRFVGGRCEDPNPMRDRNGRIISQRCFDNNPGTFHLALTHQIGIAQRSLVMDAIYDYEVWNHPIFGYSYTYFNPQTGQATEKLSEAKIPLHSYSRDKFSGYRSPQARYVVGIALDVRYKIERNPRQRVDDSEKYDRFRRARYLYDLELDSSGRIVGGEWYANKHPDFLWVPVPGSHAHSNFDSQATGAWRMDEVMPWSWRNAAINASTYNQPLGPIVEKLIRR